ncbi:unnamed protein product [Rotaria sp. Silwood2]|nr:unnamed protein product [Rotaria sp. Silwood2]
MLKYFRRYVKRNRNVHQQDNLLDYHHQYINDNNILYKKYQSKLSHETEPFAKYNLNPSMSLSDIQTNYMNIT